MRSTTTRGLYVTDLAIFADKLFYPSLKQIDNPLAKEDEGEEGRHSVENCKFSYHSYYIFRKINSVEISYPQSKFYCV